MTWTTASLEMVNALIDQSRVDTAVSGDAASNAPAYFAIYHPGIAAQIRSQIRQGGHALDANPLAVPPEFQLLVGLRIAALILSRPGIGSAGESAVFTLSREQRDLMKQMEDQLKLVSEGKAVTATDNPESTETVVSQTNPGVATVRPGIRNDTNWSGLGTT